MTEVAGLALRGNKEGFLEEVPSGCGLEGWEEGFRRGIPDRRKSLNQNKGLVST